MRFTAMGPPPSARIGPGELGATWPFGVCGPTSQAIRFGLQGSVIWGLGLQPGGFARYVGGHADAIADATLDGAALPEFAAFAPLVDLVREPDVAPDQMAVRIEACLLGLARRAVRQEPQILACQAALRDEAVSNVETLCERVGLGLRSLERLCCRYFGFPPKLLLRRQRFLRSLAQFTLAGGANWSRAFDQQYHDQAHFVRDFKAFMGSTPSEYAAAPHPILNRTIMQRMADHGALPRLDGARTDLPTVLRYRLTDGAPG